MGHLFDQPDSLGQRARKCSQRAIAIAVVGCAALALWTAPAIAADLPVTDSPPAADQAADTVSAQAPETSLDPAPAPPTVQVPDVGTDTSQAVAAQAPDSIDVPTDSIDLPAQTPDTRSSNVVDNAIRTGQAAGHTALAAGTSKASVASAVHAVPPTSTQQSSISENVARLTTDPSASKIVDRPDGEPSRTFDQGGQTPPLVIDRSRSSDPRPSVDSKRIAFPSSLMATSSFNASGSTAASADTTQLHPGGSTPGLPGLPGPLQLPGLGLAGGSNSASNGIFFFAFAILLGLLVLGGRALSKRLRTASACWQPLPFVALLERPG